MRQTQNNQYLLRMWVPILLFGLFLLIGISVGVPQSARIPLIAFVGVCGASVWWISRNSTDAKLRKLLQSPTPQPTIAFYEQAFGRTSLPERDAFLASSKAWIYAFYGQFDVARAEMSRIVWEQRPPFIQAQKFDFEAVVAYLEKREFRRGLVFAKEARELGTVSFVFPGANQSVAIYDTLVEIGQMLGAQPDSQIINALEVRLERSSMLLRILIAWALGQVYSQLGQDDRALAMRRLLAELVPYCTPFA